MTDEQSVRPHYSKPLGGYVSGMVAKPHLRKIKLRVLTLADTL
jgi:hypothetical protein